MLKIVKNIKLKNVYFGFWFNPLNIDAYTTGYFDTLEKAEQNVESLKWKDKRKIVKEYE